MSEHAATEPGPGRPRRWPLILAFLTPALLLYGVFLVYPVVQGARYSLYDWNGFGELTDFVGFANFTAAFEDDVFRGALAHNVDHPRADAAAAAPVRALPRRPAQPESPRPDAHARAVLRALRAQRGRHGRRLAPDPPARRPAWTAPSRPRPASRTRASGSRTRTSSCTASSSSSRGSTSAST